ncbi:GNAT family N-acetyltransferase [Paraburkholderia sp. LEh10]|uniref:GNAT family N-acetyltransferase n=1 Tax=Paraburkholderia sp. LEh10 TaxID=2821353 RepID=UPI001AE9999D|nr:GNAT family N-acetyltransferase [Paraburkholderia sp. LEh10]MBP0588576.1 GNAT family N-acetyltransferase [Paraburkholderia sp. LEh10]
MHTGTTSPHITMYQASHAAEVVGMILHIQNVEHNVGISIDEQSDLLDIERHYIANGGGFWVALDHEGHVVGTIALQIETSKVAVLKKFFVSAAWRGAGMGCASQLYETLIEHARLTGIATIVLDTPSVSTRSHRFYVRQGFRQIDASELPVTYAYPDRNSLLFRLDLA